MNDEKEKPSVSALKWSRKKIGAVGGAITLLFINTQKWGQTRLNDQTKRKINQV